MAETIIIDGNNYLFEAAFISLTEVEGECPAAAPITKDSIKYLEINNDLTDIGYSGKIVLSNLNKQLELIQLFEGQPKAPVIFIRLRSTDIQINANTSDDIYLFGLLQGGEEVSSNTIESNIIYKFEEYAVSRLKKTRISQNILNSIRNDSLTPIAMLEKCFDLAWNNGPKTGLGVSKPEVRGKSNNIETKISSIIGTITQISVYDLIERVYNYVSFNTGKIDALNWYSPGLIKLENDSEGSTRKLVIESLSDKIGNFLNLVTNQPRSEEIKNILLEKFNIAQSDDNPNFSDNLILKYDIKSVDYEDVQENKWTSIYPTGLQGSDCNINSIITYNSLRHAFEIIFTDPQPCNLPLYTNERKDTDTDEVKTIEYSIPGVDPVLGVVYGTNKVFKSFIFDNLAVTFRVKGKTYRTPGKFIAIRADNVDVLSKQAPEIAGYWLIVSVSHVFEGNNYFNDIVCVKIYNTKGKLTVGPPKPALRFT